MHRGGGIYRTLLPSTYKETELSEDLNGSMSWVFIYYRRYLNQEKDTLPHRYYVVEVYVWTNAKESEKNIKPQGLPSD